MAAIIITAVLLAWISSAVTRSFENKRRAEYARLEAMSKARAAQAKAAENMAKADEEIRKLKSAKVQAEVDLKLANERTNQLYALLDIAEKQEAACGCGGKEQEKAVRKIMAIRSQLAAAKKKQLKAKQVIREANIKLREVA